MKIEQYGLWSKLRGKRVYLIAILALGILLLLFPREAKKAPEPAPDAPSFRLADEERRISEALSRIDGAGSVSVVLTLDTSSEREYARNHEDSREDVPDGRISVEGSSQIADISDTALTVKYVYPRYRGALVVVQSGSSAVRLAVTQAVSALTGLSSDRITVVKGG